MKEYIDCCIDCGKKRYKVKRSLDGCTARVGVCPICKKKKIMLPANDWMFAEGKTKNWD